MSHRPAGQRLAQKERSCGLPALLPVAERFVSVNGEGPRAGRLAAFIRFTGCNLACSYCDTAWANVGECPHEDLTASQLVEWVAGTGASCVTLTGGEPALQPGVPELIAALAAAETWGEGASRSIELETNGAVDLVDLDALRKVLAEQSPRTQVAFTMDCKMPSSGMGSRMIEANYDLLDPCDAVKFVVGTHEDLEEALRVIEAYDLCERCEVFFSPVFSCIDSAQIVEFMEQHRLGQVRLQLQLHKIIWPDTDRGV